MSHDRKSKTNGRLEIGVRDGRVDLRVVVIDGESETVIGSMLTPDQAERAGKDLIRAAVFLRSEAAKATRDMD